MSSQCCLTDWFKAELKAMNYCFRCSIFNILSLRGVSSLWSQGDHKKIRLCVCVLRGVCVTCQSWGHRHGCCFCCTLCVCKLDYHHCCWPQCEWSHPPTKMEQWERMCPTDTQQHMQHPQPQPFRHWAEQHAAQEAESKDRGKKGSKCQGDWVGWHMKAVMKEACIKAGKAGHDWVGGREYWSWYQEDEERQAAKARRKKRRGKAGYGMKQSRVKAWSSWSTAGNGILSAFILQNSIPERNSVCERELMK